MNQQQPANWPQIPSEHMPKHPGGQQNPSATAGTPWSSQVGAGTPGYGQPAAGTPWSAQSGDGTPGYGQQPPGGQPGFNYPAPPSKPKRSKLPAAIATVLALTLIAAGVVFAANFLRGSTPAASKGIPANALVILEVNLNPAAADKLAVKEFVDKLPYLKEQVGDVNNDYKQAVWKLFFQDDRNLEFNQWLGESIAFAVVPTGTSPDTGALISFEVTNKAKAEAAAKKLTQPDENDYTAFEGYVFVGDLLVLYTENAKPDTAKLKANNINSNQEYQADMAKLGQGYLVTAWAGSEWLKSYVNGPLPDIAANPALAKSHGAAGLKISGGTASVRATTWSSIPTATSMDTNGFFSSIPADTILSFGTAINQQMIEQIWQLLKNPNSLDADLLQQSGMKSAADLQLLLGSQLAFTGGGTPDKPSFGIKVKTADPAKHIQLVNRIIDAQPADASEPLPRLTPTVDGDTVYWSFGIDPKQLQNADSKLGENPLFKQLVALDKDTSTVGFVNIAALVATIDENGLMAASIKELLGPFSGIGMSTKPIGDNYVETVINLGTK